MARINERERVDELHVLNSEITSALLTLWKAANNGSSKESQYAQRALQNIAELASKNPSRRRAGNPATESDNRHALSLVAKDLKTLAINEAGPRRFERRLKVIAKQRDRFCERVYTAVLLKYPQFTEAKSILLKSGNVKIITVARVSKDGSGKLHCSLHQMRPVDIFEAVRDWPGIESRDIERVFMAFCQHAKKHHRDTIPT